ncbi:uncharacterized protein LOC9640872 [Selaginella moellendorffii]|uniref:uncharacterized protein LOC9640872 n=1 Tax=Selaginella moellendorffii TaxID=88036 RepID=UPI000D1C6CAE|nr:uncharacterized protein LOC9640872 [Selaginella moellendorffii]|eukprot:XP_024522777.1 uncharacterized protein LOC9640872 [Selaginella moellendorffii]
MAAAAAEASEPAIDPKFNGDDVNTILKECLDESLASSQFMHHKASFGLNSSKNLCVSYLYAISGDLLIDRPMDIHSLREMHGQACKFKQALQVYCYLYDHAKERRWARHGKLLLLGSTSRR